MFDAIVKQFIDLYILDAVQQLHGLKFLPNFPQQADFVFVEGLAQTSGPGAHRSHQSKLPSESLLSDA